ncbi:MAG: hypothetical protein WC860_06855, partial [Candidatus Margulisiibacteriota bacterium]
MDKSLLKILFFTILIIFCIYLIGGNILYQSKFIQTFLKNKIEQELSLLLHNKIEINKISGNIFSHLIIKNICIYDKNKAIIKVATLTVYYNPLKLLFVKWDFLKSIRKISINNADAILIRNQKDQWNLLNYLDTLKKPNGKNKELPIKCGILVKNLKVTFKDEKGWGITNLQKPFIEKFININGYVNIKPKKTIIKLKSNLESNNTKSVIFVNYNFNKNSFLIDFNVDKLPLSKWGDYIFPFPGYKLSQNYAHIKGSLISKIHYNNKIELPFYYDLTIKGTQTSFKTTYLPYPLIKTDAKIHLSDAGVKIKKFKGFINQIEIYGKGEFLFTGLINLSIDTKNFDISKLNFILPQFTQLKGTSKSKFTIKGFLANPKIAGNLVIKKIKSFNLEFTDLFFTFNFSNNKLIYNLKSGLINNNQLASQGEINFNNNKNLDIKFNMPSLLMSRISGKFGQNFNGPLNINGRYFKSESKEEINFQINDPEISYYNQKINKANLTLQILNNDILIKPSEIVLNNSTESLFINGKIKNLNQLELSFNGNNILLNSINLKTTSNNIGIAN